MKKIAKCFAKKITEENQENKNILQQLAPNKTLFTHVLLGGVLNSKKLTPIIKIPIPPLKSRQSY